MNEHVQTTTTEPLFNPLSPEFIRDPYPHYERLREHDPMHLTPFGAFVASRHAEASLVLRDKRFGKDYRRAHDTALRTEDHGGAGLSQHEPLDAAAGSARPHAPARSGREGVYRAQGRGHAAAHPAGRRSNDRPDRRPGPHGPDRGFRVPPAGHDHLRHARDSRGTSRGVLQQLARRRTPARSGAAQSGRNRAGQRRQSGGPDVFPAAIRVAPAGTPATT